MTALPTVRAWLCRSAGCFNRRRRDQELHAELEAHLQAHVDDNLRAGMPPTEARRIALAAIGIHGLLSYTAQGRRQEVGVHVALGARRSTVPLGGVMTLLSSAIPAARAAAVEPLTALRAK